MNMRRHMKKNKDEYEATRLAERAIAEEEQGEWFKRNAEAGFAEEEESYAVKSGGRHLDDFIEDQRAVTDDEDIYKEYQEMASRRQDRLKDAQSDFKLDKNDAAPEMPTFDDYFDSKSQGVHPFDRVTNSFEDSEINDHESFVHEEEREHALHQRELLGRLFGGELTPRQYELVAGMYRDEDVMTKRVRDVFGNQFITNRDNVRLIEELYEKTRRQKVLSGEWTEEESNKRLQALMEDDHDKMLGPKAYNRFMASYRKYKWYEHTTANPDAPNEKEYHFDETAGVSLNEHVAGLKKQFPEATIQTRRDREGFAVVKVLQAKEYKYDLKKLLAFDPQESQERLLESLEQIMKAAGSEAVDLDSASPEEAKQVISSLLGGNQMAKDIDSESKAKLKELTEARLTGRYKHDLDGFMSEFSKIQQGATIVDGATTSAPSLFDHSNDDVNAAMQQSISDIFEDRSRFREEINEQLRVHVTAHMQLKGRKA